MTTVLIVGGYGNAGAQISRLLRVHSDVAIRVGGRDLGRAQAFVDDLQLARRDVEAAAAGGRTTALRVDLLDRASVERAMTGVDLCIVAAGSASSSVAVDAALDVGVDYLDIQVGRSKADRLLALDEQARAAGVTLVTDGGFHPGLPAAMVRYAIDRLGTLERAVVGSVIAVDWRHLQPIARSTVADMMEEFRDFAYEEYRDHAWVRARRQPTFAFPEPFGRRRASAMGLAEMHQLSDTVPQLGDTGFYVGGFNPVVDNMIIPAALLGMRAAPNRLADPLGRLLHWGLLRFARPPYGTVLQLEGNTADAPSRVLMRISHADAYTLTAAPVVACALQVIDGTATAPGAHTQAMIVEPVSFFADLVRMGIDVEWLGQRLNVEEGTSR